jgi:phosphate transport system permease protein
MTTVLVPPGSASPQAFDDVPLNLRTKPSWPDRVFNGLLAGSSGVVLVVLAAMLTYLAYWCYPAIHAAGFGLFTDKTWNPDMGQFGMLPLLVGSIAIALIAVGIATPISFATALMINEYAPKRMKPILTAVIDLLATVPSIVYGFWGLLLISGLQAKPARWLVEHMGYVPIFRTLSPGFYVKSIFACGLICSVTIIPIITSISREVMAQAPREVCEAALGLGGTRWGMVTDVIFPFARNGILGAVLLGIGRGLGETMIPAIVLSTRNLLTSAVLGPGGLGSIARQIAQNFADSSQIYKEGLVLLGLVLFVTTLVVNVLARIVAQRPGKAF